MVMVPEVYTREQKGWGGSCLVIGGVVAVLCLCLPSYLQGPFYMGVYEPNAYEAARSLTILRVRLRGEQDALEVLRALGLPSL